MKLKRACIYHPTKCITNIDNFNREMMSLADVLWATKAYSEIVLLYGEQDLSSFDEIWCSCYDANVICESLLALPLSKLLIYIANDPAYFALPEAIADRINFIAFAGSNPDYYKSLFHDKPIFKIPMWQNLFKKQKRAKLKELHSYTYQIGYAGNNRTSWREMRLKHFLEDIDARDSKIIGCLNNSKLNYLQTRLCMKKCLSQLVIGDLDYIGLFPLAHRLLQGLTLSPYCFIDAELHSNFGNETIDKHFVITDSKQILDTLYLITKDEEFAQEAYKAFNTLFKELTEYTI